MAKIKVNLEAFYGYGHGCSYGSKDTIELEISEQELEALKKFGTKEISCEEVVEAIENGETSLQPLHEKLEEKFYYMVEEYWLFEAYNEFLRENLEKYIVQDIEDKLYTPVLEDEEDSEGIYDDDEDSEECNRYDLNHYYEWIREQGHDFAADRVGVDILAIRENEEVDYTIMLE